MQGRVGRRTVEDTLVAGPASGRIAMVPDMFLKFDREQCADIGAVRRQGISNFGNTAFGVVNGERVAQFEIGDQAKISAGEHFFIRRAHGIGAARLAGIEIGRHNLPVVGRPALVRCKGERFQPKRAYVFTKRDIALSAGAVCCEIRAQSLDIKLPPLLLDARLIPRRDLESR